MKGRTFAKSAAGTLVVLLAAGAAHADTTADLIELDRQWGAAGTKGDVDAVGKLLADGLVSVDAEGVRDKKGELALVKPEPAGTAYEPTDYKVTLLGADMAIMTHGTKGKDAHHSLHVWSRKGGKWQVVATSSTPVKK
ncbi:MAG TPA: nuclear transport factor 2 family protein [Steroidobacteraceae bacterium]|jgi:ketosteroid isomerase-like protein|nr:nuclear transport factor 2 family protein [Steroidobacteraceae bacterium]